MTNNVDNFFEQPASGTKDNKLVVGGSLETAGGASLKTQAVTLKIADISTAGQTFFLAPFAGALLKVTSVLNGAITGADAVLTVKTQEGTAGTITVANSGSAAGDIDSLTVSSNATVTAGSLIEVETDGASTGTVPSDITLEIALS